MADFLFEIFFQIILLPISLVLATPVILILGLFGKEKYLANIKRYYKTVIHFYLNLT